MSVCPSGGTLYRTRESTRLSEKDAPGGELCSLVCLCVRRRPSGVRQSTRYESTRLSEKEAAGGKDCSQPRRWVGGLTYPRGGVVTTKMGHQAFGANEYPGADADAVVQYKNSSEAGANPLISSALDARGAAPAPVATAELRRGETSCATAFRTRRAFPANLQVGKTGGPP